MTVLISTDIEVTAANGATVSIEVENDWKRAAAEMQSSPRRPFSSNEQQWKSGNKMLVMKSTEQRSYEVHCDGGSEVRKCSGN
jgi:hypothetical protein